MRVEVLCYRYGKGTNLCWCYLGHSLLAAAGLIYGLGGLCHHKYYHSVLHIGPPPPRFATLALGKSEEGGGGGEAYIRDLTFYLTNMPLFRGHA